MTDAPTWHREDTIHGSLLYTLRPEVTRRGKGIMVNDVTVRIERENGSDTDIGPIVDKILWALNGGPVK